jgi:membrane protein implicated in regulation of membrane protease activity
MEDERPLIEKIADAVTAFYDIWLAVIGIFITAALLIMGNTLARLIGLSFLIVLLVLSARRLRSWQRS